jgi:glycosyltransferase 2 family protein
LLNNRKLSKKNRPIFTIIKSVVTAGLLVIIVLQLREISLKEVFRDIKWLYFFIAFLLFVLHNVLGAWRWATLLKKFHISYNLIVLVKYYYIGNFISFFMPTSIGGDIARIIFLQRESHSIEIGSSSVIVERILGIIAIIMLFSLSVAMGLKDITDMSFFWPAISVLIVFLMLILLLFFFPIKMIDKISFIPEKLRANFRSTMLTLRSYRTETSTLIQALVLSLLFQLTIILSYYLLAASIQLRIPVHLFLLFMPLIWILTLLPLSLNGLGLREGSFIYFFSSAGYDSELLSIISILGVLLLVIQGLIGGILLLFDKRTVQEIKELTP